MKILGAIIGDMSGSTREWNNEKTTDVDGIELLPSNSKFTDDTVMTLAVAEWLMIDTEHHHSTLVECMQRWGRKYRYAGYGGMFRRWLRADKPKPYNSFGNGSAMRVSPVGLYAHSLYEALSLARISAEVTHNHPEGIKGAQAIAVAVYMAKNSNSAHIKEDVKDFISNRFGYNLDINLADIRPSYTFDVTCQGSVPIAIMAYLQSGPEPEKALQTAISMGGDSDTIGAMTASIASASCLFNDYLESRCLGLLPTDLRDINDRFIEFLKAN